MVGVTGTAVNQGPSFTAGTYNIRVSEGIPVGSSVFASPVRYTYPSSNWLSKKLHSYVNKIRHSGIYTYA